MTWLNEASWDRVVRVLVGIVLLYLGWSGTVAGPPGAIIKWLGFLPLLTGLVGWCPAYTLFKFGTKKA